MRLWHPLFVKVTSALTMTSIMAATLASCAGATPHPVPQYQPQDNYLTCNDIRREMADNQTKMLNLVPKQNKVGKNVFLGVAGAFFVFPWFFMDFSDAERIEVQAYQLRNNWLHTLAEKKKCKSIPRTVKFLGQ